MLERQIGRDMRPLCLGLGQVREVEKRCDAGLGEIAARLAPILRLLELGVAKTPGGLMTAVAGGHLGRWRIDDVREPLVQGLIGGGMTSTEAGALAALVFDEALKAGRAPALEFVEPAFAVIMRAIIGLEDEPLGETPAAGATAKKPARRRSPTARPASPTSTPPAP